MKQEILVHQTAKLLKVQMIVPLRVTKLTCSVSEPDVEIWAEAKGNTLKKFKWNSPSNAERTEETPYDFYNLFLTDELINLLLEYTNKHANRIVSKSKSSPINGKTPLRQNCVNFLVF